MRNISLTIIFFTLLISSCNNRQTEPSPVRIIFDTDCGPDYDDVGALAFLHAMADSGKATILATVSSNRNELVVPSIDVINTYFGKPDIPLGAPKSKGADMGPFQHWADSIVAKYPHRMKSTSEAPDAVSVYRKILGSQPDNSVTVVTVGFLTNLCNLLKSEPDSFSPLTGTELVKKKVKTLVSMAGWFPKGREFNIFIDSTASAFVYENWPGKVVFTGYEVGKDIKTGLRLVNSPITNSAVKDVFRISLPLAGEDRMGRMSWDETAVLIAVYGTEKFFNTVNGTIHIAPDGSNTWEENSAGKHSYVVMKVPPDEIARFIEARMMHQPFRHNQVVKPAIFRKISHELLRDKIAGGWAGKMIGVTYGAPTEFHALQKIFEDPINWKPSDIKGSIWQDDLYVQLTFLMAMDKYGVDAPVKKFQELFAKAGYPLWHANMQARKNYFDSIFAPLSGEPEYNIHADDIDFQIEADYIGFMCPGMPQKATAIASKIGHIMNYGDGLYGGIFVSALYSEAFFGNDIKEIINNALKSIPAECDYHRIIEDVITLHSHYADWREAWKELDAKWGDEDICGAGAPFNIDAKLNGAYIVMGLLYGNGDPEKTLDITTRCGQDSDCNPSNALAVLGVMKGFSGLPDEMRKGVEAIGDSLFINTNYTFNRAVTSTMEYAIRFIQEDGGTVSGSMLKVKVQDPISPIQEVSFPNLVFEKNISLSESNDILKTGKWNIQAVAAGKKPGWIVSGKSGDNIAITFEGTGISINGNWVADGGKADILVDGQLNRSIDTYYNFAGQQHGDVSIWHVTGLPEGSHTVKLIIRGEKRPESDGTNVYVSSATIFKTAPKKSDNYKFSFE